MHSRRGHTTCSPTACVATSTSSMPLEVSIAKPARNPSRKRLILIPDPVSIYTMHNLIGFGGVGGVGSTELRYIASTLIMAWPAMGSERLATPEDEISCGWPVRWRQGQGCSEHGRRVALLHVSMRCTELSGEAAIISLVVKLPPSYMPMYAPNETVLLWIRYTSRRAAT